MSNKVKTKEQEMKARADSDQKSKDSVLGLYDKKLAKVKEAREHCGSEYFQTGFRARKSTVENACKRLKEAAETHSYDLEIADDLKPHKTALKDASNAIKRLDEFTHDARRDCLDLEAYILQYDDSPLFEKEMPEIAYWNNKKGIVDVKKRK